MPMRPRTALSDVFLIYLSDLLATTSAYRPTKTFVTGSGMNMSASGQAILVENYCLKDPMPKSLVQQLHLVTVSF